jgi:hypothetical protein
MLGTRVAPVLVSGSCPCQLSPSAASPRPGSERFQFNLREQADGERRPRAMRFARGPQPRSAPFSCQPRPLVNITSIIRPMRNRQQKPPVHGLWTVFGRQTPKARRPHRIGRIGGFRWRPGVAALNPLDRRSTGERSDWRAGTSGTQELLGVDGRWPMWPAGVGESEVA